MVEDSPRHWFTRTFDLHVALHLVRRRSARGDERRVLILQAKQSVPKRRNVGSVLALESRNRNTDPTLPRFGTDCFVRSSTTCARHGWLRSQSLPLILSLDRVNFRHSLFVPVFRDFRIEPSGDDLSHFGGTDSLTSQRENVCPVVFT